MKTERLISKAMKFIRKKKRKKVIFKEKKEQIDVEHFLGLKKDVREKVEEH